MKQKKKQNKTLQKSSEFTLEDVLNAPKAKAPVKNVSGLGCNNCGSMRFIAKGEIKVFRGKRMKTYHCYDCGQDFYKGE